MNQESTVLENKGRELFQKGWSGIFLFFIKVYLMYNTELVSSVQKSDCHIYLYIYICTYICVYINLDKYENIYILFSDFSLLDYYQILNTVPCVYSKSLLVIYTQ